ncbi:replication initiator protein A [Clostridium gasigenes]|uniref:Replication initiator protein A n=1 Tax=Clostridium gasigenes TaxID=94869 RepID=A0A7X0VQY8_9CLOT|nr:replication initiator protein A [Clostridium gasigenes]
MEKFKYVLENEKISGGYINIPIELYTSSGYKDLSNDAILLYGVLLNNFKFSSQSGRRDEKGRLFVIASLSNIMKIIRCSRNTARKVLEELGKFHLIKFNEGEDKNRVRNIYLGVLRKEISEGDKISTSIGLKKEPYECKKSTNKGSEKEPVDVKKSTADGSKYELERGQYVNPNKNIYKNNYKNSGFKKGNEEECPYYEEFDFED